MDITSVSGSLKWLVRTGWMQRGVPASIGETVAQHSFEVSLIALELAYRIRDSGIHVDAHKAAVMGLVHDIAESVVGDLPRWSSDRMGGLKEKLEASAIELLEIHSGLKVLHKEYEEGETLEASIARLADLVSTCVQARRYRQSGYNVDDILNGTKEKALNLVENCCPQIKQFVSDLCE